MANFMYMHPWIIMVILVWSLPWKGAALWKSARMGHIGWFIVLLIINTLGILDILYIFIFSQWGDKNIKEQQTPDRQPRRYPPNMVF
jgi:hypothetical protein